MEQSATEVVSQLWEGEMLKLLAIYPIKYSVDIDESVVFLTPISAMFDPPRKGLYAFTLFSTSKISSDPVCVNTDIAHMYPFFCHTALWAFRRILLYVNSHTDILFVLL